jgi:hypothetical protein
MRRVLAPLFACAIFFGAMRAAWEGPPYQTDDPVPVAYRNYEIYIGYEGEYTHGESETSLPFAEIKLWTTSERADCRFISAHVYDDSKRSGAIRGRQRRLRYQVPLHSRKRIAAATLSFSLG